MFEENEKDNYKRDELFERNLRSGEIYQKTENSSFNNGNSSVYKDNPEVINCNSPINEDTAKPPYYKETVKCKSNKKISSFKQFIAACLTISLFGGIGIGSSYSAMENLVFNKQGSGTDNSSNAGNEAGVISHAESVSKNMGTMTAPEVIDKTFPSVVNINTDVKGTQNYYGFSVPYEGKASGSGIIFNSDDKYVYMVTNNHVVDGAKQIFISVSGNEKIEAKVVGVDSNSDIAVIKSLKTDFESQGITNIVVAKFGDSDNIKVGQSVIAIGNALGEGKSATGGMISTLSKKIEIDGLKLEVIQTSSPINPGNSGGALVDYNGNIIGVNTAKTSTTVAEGMGYAIPSNTVKTIMENLVVNGTTPKPSLGIMGSDITDDISEMYKLPVGVLVREVFPASSAEKAGLKEGDIIVSFGKKSIMNMNSLIDALKQQKIGAKVEMNIIRDGEKSMTLTIEILDANNA